MTITITEKKLLKNLREYGFMPKENQFVTNPFSGVTVELSPDAFAVYIILKAAEQLPAKIEATGLGWPKGTSPEQNADIFDQHKILFLKKWPKEYMELID